MSTKSQNKANRQNSKKSTGPKTAKGKAAVSKNAVKHGLFAAEAVVTGEDPADYEAYHDQFFAELAPVGMVESMFAERVVSLSWRLQRAERMQNQCIEDFIERKITNPLPRRTRVLMCNAEGIPLGDHRCTSSHLPLGRIATIDWSNNRVLERLFMYERRIESSMYKTLNKLKTYQVMRVIQEADARKQETAQATQSVEKNGYLKKQTQFAPAQMDVTSYMKGGYGNMPAGGIEENKANSNPNKTNQSQLSESVLTKVAGKRKQTLAAANSLTE